MVILFQTLDTLYLKFKAENESNHKNRQALRL